MRRSRPILLLIAVALALASCCPAKQPNLRARILAAKTSQFCRLPDACFNPFVLAFEDGFMVTTFQGAQPRNVRVPGKDLGKYLEALPMQAWPRGPSIVLTQSDDVIDESAVERNLDDARLLLQSFGLEVEFRPGG